MRCLYIIIFSIAKISVVTNSKRMEDTMFSMLVQFISFKPSYQIIKHSNVAVFILNQQSSSPTVIFGGECLSAEVVKPEITPFSIRALWKPKGPLCRLFASMNNLYTPFSCSMLLAI